MMMVYLFLVTEKLFKNEIFVSHIAVGGDTNRGDPPWSRWLRDPTGHFFQYYEIQ
jgi:hypothetical protein